MAYDVAPLAGAGRLLIVGYFVVAGLCNLTPDRIRDHIDRMAAMNTPLPAAVFWTGIVLQFSGSALLLADWHAEVGAAFLIVFTIAATLIFHRFWTKRDPQQRNLSRIILLNNTGVLGGLLLLLHDVG